MILLDHNIPVQIRSSVPAHDTASAGSMGWDLLTNGELLGMAEQAAFDVLVTADQNIFYQQNNRARRIGLVVLGTNYRPALETHSHWIVSAVDRASAGSFELVGVPLIRRRLHRAIE